MKIGIIVIDGLRSEQIVLELEAVPQSGSLVRDPANKAAYQITDDPFVYYPNSASAKVDVVVFAVFGEINLSSVLLADRFFT